MLSPFVIVNGLEEPHPGSVWYSHIGIVKRQTMTDDTDDSETEEYRQTDWLAINHGGLAYHAGAGITEEQALWGCLKHAGPWGEDRDEPVEVAVWRLRADSWQSCDPTGPEAGAEQIGHRVYEIPVGFAREVHRLATDLDTATDRALNDAKVIREDGDLD